MILHFWLNFNFTDIIDSCFKSPNFELKESFSLCFDKTEPEYEPDGEFDYDEDDEPTKAITLKQKIEAVNFWKSSQKGKRKFSSVQSKFRFLANESQLYRFEKQIQNYGTRKDKLKII